MSETDLQVCVDLELAGVGAGWTDVTADLLRKVQIVCDYGIQGSTPADRVAGTGTLSFGLDNSETNSVGLLGYYSPGHANCRSGFAMGIGVRLRFVYMELNLTKWQGLVDEITPEAGAYEERQTTVNCVDWMDEAARTKLNMVPVQLDVRSDQVFSTIVANVPKQPPSITLGYGMERYAYALDTSTDEGFSVLTEFQKLAMSELGFVYVKGGALCFEDRRKRGTLTSSVASFNGVNAIAASRKRDSIINHVKVTVHPRKADVASAAFDPSTIAGMMLWLKADAIVGLNDGDALTTWADVSGQAHDFTQASATLKPLYKTGVVNGKPIVRFDGSNDTMTGPVISSMLSATAGTILVVAKRTGGHANGFIFGSSGSGLEAGIYASSAAGYIARSGNSILFSITNSAWLSLTWMHSGGNLYIGANDTRDASLNSVASGSATLTDLLQLGLATAATYYFGGDIAELLIWNVVLSEADRKNVESYLSAKYSITVPYPLTGGGASGQLVIFTLNQISAINQGTSYVFNAPYTNPAGSGTGGVRIGAVGQLQPVVTTDYLFNTLASGAGVNISSQLTVTCVFGGNTAQVTIVNNGPLDGYLTFFQIRGLGVYDQAEVVLEASSPASIASFGENLLPFDMPYQSDPAVASDAANYLLAQDKSSQTVLTEVGFIANASDSFIRQALLRDISDRIDVVESQTAVNGSFFINGVSLQVDEEGMLVVVWTVIPALSELYFTLDSATLAQLDSTTKLAYGLWNRYWILEVATLGSDTRLNP